MTSFWDGFEKQAAHGGVGAYLASKIKKTKDAGKLIQAPNSGPALEALRRLGRLEKDAASVSGMPAVLSGSTRNGITATPKPGVTIAPKAAKQSLPTPQPAKPTTTAAVLPKPPAPVKVGVPKPTGMASSMSI